MTIKDIRIIMTISRQFSDFVMDYFKRFPGRDLFITLVLKEATKAYMKVYKSKPYEPLKAIDDLCKEGKLIEVQKGLYRYERRKRRN